MLDMNAKYIVFKTEEFLQFMATLPVGVATPEYVEDAVVIRRQDVFAPPALDAYSNAIRTSLELLRSDEALSDPRVRNLASIADYFHEQAVLSWDTDRKIPD